jgi:hypothetical protein
MAFAGRVGVELKLDDASPSAQGEQNLVLFIQKKVVLW